MQIQEIYQRIKGINKHRKSEILIHDHLIKNSQLNRILTTDYLEVESSTDKTTAGNLCRMKP